MVVLDYCRSVHAPFPGYFVLTYAHVIAVAEVLIPVRLSKVDNDSVPIYVYLNMFSTLCIISCLSASFCTILSFTVACPISAVTDTTLVVPATESRESSQRLQPLRAAWKLGRPRIIAEQPSSEPQRAQEGLRQHSQDHGKEVKKGTFSLLVSTFLMVNILFFISFPTPDILFLRVLPSCSGSHSRSTRCNSRD